MGGDGGEGAEPPPLWIDKVGPWARCRLGASRQGAG